MEGSPFDLGAFQAQMQQYRNSMNAYHTALRGWGHGSPGPRPHRPQFPMIGENPLAPPAPQPVQQNQVVQQQPMQQQPVLPAALNALHPGMVGSSYGVQGMMPTAGFGLPRY